MSQAQILRNKTLVREVFARVINGRDISLATQYYAPDYMQHNPRVAPGLAGLQSLLEYLFTAFSPLHGELALMLAEDDKVMALVEWRGIHSGTFVGLAATDKNFSFRSVELFRIQNNMIVEHWDVVENTEMMLNLGLLQSQASEQVLGLDL